MERPISQTLDHHKMERPISLDHHKMERPISLIKFVNDFLQVGGFLKVLTVSSTNKTDRHDITEILLKVALSTIILTLQFVCKTS
jgi:hypothetical protein